MDIFQSTAFTLARVRLSLYEQRIIVKIAESAQPRINGLHLREHAYKLPHDCDNVKVLIPIRYILSSKSHNYSVIEQAAQHLCTVTWTVHDSETGAWVTGSVLNQAQYTKRSGTLEVHVNRFFYDALYDFTHGYKRYELEQCLSLNSPVAIRLYQMFYNQVGPIDYTIDYLKKTFGVTDKYSQTADFIKKVIDPALKELVRAGVHHFKYVRVKHGQKVTGLHFEPIKVHRKEDAFFSTMSMETMSNYKAVRVVMARDAGFTNKELDCHLETLRAFSAIPDAFNMILDITHRATKKDNAKPYIVAAIKAEVKSFNDCPRPKDAKTS